MNARKLNFQFDVEAMTRELTRLAPGFSTIYSKSTQDNRLRGTHLITPVVEGQQQQDGRTYQHTPELDQSPYLQTVLETFKCDKFNFRVHNLLPQGKITPHRDFGKSLIDGIVRIHIPVTTNEDIHFFVDGEEVRMQNGECWLADIGKIHEVENRSASERLQLMIDCDLNSWWEAVLKDHDIDLPETNNWSRLPLEALRTIRENVVSKSAEIDTAILTILDHEIEQREYNG